MTKPGPVSDLINQIGRGLRMSAACCTVICAVWWNGCAGAQAQDPQLRFGTQVTTEVDRIYVRGLAYLAKVQEPDGSWQSNDNGCGIDGICLMAFLAAGEDPNFGPYADHIRRAVRAIIVRQDADTGYLPNSMYHHGFAMLALSEVFAAIDEELLWSGAPADQLPKRRSLAEVLDLAVRCAVTSAENNQFHAWRYSPEANDADTSVSGAVLMGLFAARNAGIKVPDTCIDQALEYFKSMTTNRGEVGYSGIGGGGSDNLKAIAALVMAIGKRKDWQEYEAVLKRVAGNLEETGNNHYQDYFRYYQSQALFQGDFEAWQKWNTLLTDTLKDTQGDDGSFPGSYGPAYGTGMALLSLGLNYRFLPIYER